MSSPLIPIYLLWNWYGIIARVISSVSHIQFWVPMWCRGSMIGQTPVLYAISGLTSITRDKWWQDQFNMELFAVISYFDFLVVLSFSFMPKFQGYGPRLLMLQSVYECIGFRCLVFLLGLHPECSLSSSLSFFDLWYLFQVRFRACA